MIGPKTGEAYKWGSESVYNLIDNREIQKNNGRFSIDDLTNYWNSQTYPKHKHYELLTLLSKFELCMNLIGTDRFIIPELLSPQEPPAISKWFKTLNHDVARVEIRYTKLPPGIVTRLICKLHYLAPIDKIWRFGAAFVTELGDALVIQNKQSRTLQIRSRGIQRYSILNLIRNELDQIHDSLNLVADKDYHQTIACTCIRCQDSTQPHYFEFSVLKGFSAHGRDKITCNKSYQDVSIADLIAGIGQSRDSLFIVNEVIVAVAQFQGNNKVVPKDEDARNSYIEMILSSRGSITKDQTRWGSSPTGKRQGELDIRIQDDTGMVRSIFEGCNLTSINKGNITAHIDKIVRYDHLGLQKNFLVNYVTVSDFPSFCERYHQFVDSLLTQVIQLQECEDVSMFYTHGSEMKVLRSTYLRNGLPHMIYHVLANIQ